MATTGTLQAIRNGVLAIGVCASLVIGSLGFAGSAEARIPQDGLLMSDFARLCKIIQDKYDAEVRLQNWDEVNSLVNEWINIGCLAAYGYIDELRPAVQPSSATQGTPTTSPTKVQRVTSPGSIAR
jgi:hypothetical protein